MKKILSVCSLALSLFAAAAPATRLTVDNADVMVTESWSAKIVFYLEPLTGRFADTCPLSSPSSFPSFFESHRAGLAIRNFPAEEARFSHAIDREEIDGINYWRVTLSSEPVKAVAEGIIEVGPVVVEATLFDGRFRRGFFGNEPHRVNRAFKAPRVLVRVSEVPKAGRPAQYCGAIGSNVTMSASLDTNICTSGDPLMLTLKVAGAIDQSRLRAPDVAGEIEKGGYFRVDRASLKSSSSEKAKVFTWRIRAHKAGTVEFPALSMAYFDTSQRAYRMCQTQSLPVQVKAGEQVALALAEDEDQEAWPMPDGLDFDFPASGNADFTFRRAVAAAVSASSPSGYAAAARIYGDYLAQLGDNPLATFAPLKTYGARAKELARHLDNLGALRLMGEDARGAMAAVLRASEFAGDTPSRIRALRAASAKLKNDPRAELPLSRVLCPAFFRLNLVLRIAATFAGLLILCGVWWAAGRLGRTGALLFAVMFSTLGANADWPFAGGGGMRVNSRVKASLALSPAEVVVGEMAHFIFTFEVEKGVAIEELQVRGLPSADDGAVEYGKLERMAPLSVANAGIDTHRVRLPVKFNRPFQGEASPLINGMLVLRRGNGSSFSFTSSTSFSCRANTIKLEVAPLPTEHMPADFSGIVGKRLRLRLALSPEKVRPGDLVTADYSLDLDGYCPTNLVLALQGLTPEFKAYEPKEIARSSTGVKWRRLLVPLTSNATNRLMLAANYYDVSEKRYSEVKSRAAHLVFVSRTAASTTNTTVVIDTTAAKEALRYDGVRGEKIELRFAPSAASPIVAVLPPNTPLTELSRHGAWRRVAAAAAIGWVK